MESTGEKNGKQTDALRKPRALLSGQQVVEGWYKEINIPPRNLKCITPENSETEVESIAQMKESFRQLICQERLKKSADLSLGDYEKEQNRVRVLKQERKWNLYGFTENNIKYIHPYEALYLLEMGRIEIRWNTGIVSVEQGYVLFLGPPKNLSFEEYFVYSTIMKAGYCILEHDSNRIYKKFEEKDKVLEEERYVWKNLLELLGQDSKNSDKINETLLQKVKSSMSNISQLTKRSPETTDKRKLSESGTVEKENSKKIKLDENITKDEQFKKMFEKISLIENAEEEDFGSCGDDIKISFDMFTCDHHTFKRSEPEPPCFRIVIKKSSDKLPTSGQIVKLYKQRGEERCPIMVIIVSESMTLHNFVYDLKNLYKNKI